MAEIELSVVMPCLNEADTVAKCVHKGLEGLKKAKCKGEIVLADNGSTDGSQQLAKKAGARVVVVREKGYGAALMGGIEAAKGRYVLMGDADDSYDFSEIGAFVMRECGVWPGAGPWRRWDPERRRVRGARGCGGTRPC